MKVKNENYITIQGWMRKELNLTGNNLLVYALIYSFSQTENQKFTASLQYIADWCGATKQGIIKNLKALIDMGLIEKKETIINNVTYNEYYITEFNGVVNSVKQGSKHSLPNNINNNTNNKILSKDKNNFEFGQVKQPKQSLYGSCISMIYDFSDNKTIQHLLKDFLDSLVEMKKLRGQKQFAGILNKLAECGKTEAQQIKVIEYTIEKGYATFYAINDSTRVTATSSDMGRQSNQYTEEQKRKSRKAIADGTAEKF